MAQLKSTVVQGALTVTGNVVANKLIKLGGTASQILMADGSVKGIGDLISVPNISVTDTGTDPIIGDITASGHTLTVTRIGLDDLGLASAYKYKGSVETYDDLPVDENIEGDVWNVQTDGMNYAWTGLAWDALGGSVDLSGYTEGAASSTDNAIVRFDGTSGKKIQNSTATIDDNGNLSISGNLYVPENKYAYFGTTELASFRGNANGAFIVGAYSDIYLRGGLSSNDSSSSSKGVQLGASYLQPETTNHTTLGASGKVWKNVYATQYTSTVGTGTAPFAVTSTTLNTNLNADLLDGKHASDFQLAGNYLTSESDTLQTVTNRGSTTTNAVKIQNGAAAGCLVLGGNSGGTGISANTRKLARVTIPDYADASKTIAIFSADANTASLHSIEFGSRQGDGTSYAPNLMSFSVGATAATTDRYNVAQYQYNKIQFFNHASGASDIKKTPSTDLVGMWEFNNGNTFVNNAYTYTLPNKTGTIALTSDLPTVPDVSDFVTKSTNQTITGIKTFSHSTFGAIVLKRNGSTNASSIIFQNNNGTLGSIGMTSTANGGLKRWSADTASSYTIWDSGNDGSGSTLDADLLDGKHASEFALVGDIPNDYLPKTTYEWNKEFAAGSNGAVSLGRYNLYDTQLTFDITTTTTITLSGKLVIASQNGSIKKVTIYGDASNTLVNYLTIYQSAISNSRSWVEVFCNFPGWSKNKVHIYGVALNSATVTNQMASVTFTNGVPSGVTSGDSKWTGTIVNDITSNCAAIDHSHDVNIAVSTGTNELTLAHGTKYALTAGGQSFIFTTPADNNTTYEADRGISLESGKFGHSNTAVTEVTTAGLYKIKYDAYGHITGTESFTLPTVNNGTLTIQKNGTNVVTFTANQSGNATANITVPDPTDYYWANVKVSSTSSTATTPSVQKIGITGSATTNAAAAVTMEYDSSYKALKFVFA